MTICSDGKSVPTTPKIHSSLWIHHIILLYIKHWQHSHWLQFNRSSKVCQLPYWSDFFNLPRFSGGSRYEWFSEYSLTSSRCTRRIPLLPTGYDVILPVSAQYRIVAWFRLMISPASLKVNHPSNGLSTGSFIVLVIWIFLTLLRSVHHDTTSLTDFGKLSSNSSVKVVRMPPETRHEYLPGNLSKTGFDRLFRRFWQEMPQIRQNRRKNALSWTFMNYRKPVSAIDKLTGWQVIETCQNHCQVIFLKTSKMRKIFKITSPDLTV